VFVVAALLEGIVSEHPDYYSVVLDGQRSNNQSAPVAVVNDNTNLDCNCRLKGIKTQSGQLQAPKP
jgi:hypothetical protein